MDIKIQEIAERIKGIRDALELESAECANACGISIDQYRAYEDGNEDIPVSFLHRFSEFCHVELTTLISGDVPRMRFYSLTRKGTGPVVKRRSEYDYQSLNYSFIGKKAQPFLVTVSPVPEQEPVPFYLHEGQEFNMVLKGRLMIVINGRELILEEGDSLWFNSGLPHGMKALDGEKAEFLAMIF